MNKNQVYSFEGDPAIIIGEEENSATALVLMNLESTCHVVLINTQLTNLEPYRCPEADDTVVERIYCEGGICKYPIPDDSAGACACLAGRCTRCLLESCEAIDVEDTDEANN